MHISQTFLRWGGGRQKKHPKEHLLINPPFQDPLTPKGPQSLSDCPSRPIPFLSIGPVPRTSGPKMLPGGQPPSAPALAQVQLLVLREVRFVAEALATTRALVRLVASVDAAVANQV